MPAASSALARAQGFCEAFGLRVPVLLAPMAGACPPSLSIAVANAGGLGACGALADATGGNQGLDLRSKSRGNGAFQLNLWIPDPPPQRDPVAEGRVRTFLRTWGPEVAQEAGDATPPDFEAQCEAMLEAGPAIISSIMGLYPPTSVARMKARGISMVRYSNDGGGGEGSARCRSRCHCRQGMEAGVIAAHSMLRKRKPAWSACSRCCPPWVDAVQRSSDRDRWHR